MYRRSIVLDRIQEWCIWVDKCSCYINRSTYQRHWRPKIDNHMLTVGVVQLFLYLLLYKATICKEIPFKLKSRDGYYVRQIGLDFGIWRAFLQTLPGNALQRASRSWSLTTKQENYILCKLTVSPGTTARALAQICRPQTRLSIRTRTMRLTLQRNVLHGQAPKKPSPISIRKDTWGTDQGLL